jgi:hypothetical protein
LPGAPLRPGWREDSDTVMWLRWLRANWRGRRAARRRRRGAPDGP